MKKSVFLIVGALVWQMAFAAAPEIKNVVARQRYPWNGKVDVTYDLAGNFPTKDAFVIKVSAKDSLSGATYEAEQSALSGDMDASRGTHCIVWDLNAQGLEFKSDAVVFTVTYTTSLRYCIIDLSAGADASSYSVTYLETPPSGGFNADEYKTTKLVMRLIEPGSFKMCGKYDVTLTKQFYCGIFEVTQKQYELVTGSTPSHYKGDMRPVECVSWNAIRGNSGTYNWPSTTSVDPNSFVGRLQARTGLNFDLPTEAQWEYACRAGTTSKYNNGGDSEDDLKLLGRYSGNRSDSKGGYTDAHTTVGSYLPNAWGLYDTHGNVWEWCLDWYADLSGGVTDPVGSSSGSGRVLRGGSWSSGAFSCASSLRSNSYPSNVISYIGFRLVRTLSE